MRKYMPSKRPLIIIDILIFFGIIFIKAILEIIGRFAHFRLSGFWIVWVIAAFAALIFLPIFFFGVFYTVSAKEITACRSLIISRKTLMSANAVKSVTAIMLPLSRFTGMNFVVINALGSRLVIPFLSKSDTEEITAILNRTIRERNSNSYEK